MGGSKAVIEIAHRMVEDYGDHAAERIDRRARQCEREGDLEAARLWLRVGQAARELQKSARPDASVSIAAASQASLPSPHASPFQRAFEATPNPYLLLTPDLRIAAVNDAYLNASITRRVDIIGRLLFEVTPDIPELDRFGAARNLKASLERVIELGLPDRLAVQRYDVRRPDGMSEERWWATLNVPVLDENGALQFIIHCVEDVTARVVRTDT
jgi:PAS domain-containing protein